MASKLDPGPDVCAEQDQNFGANVLHRKNGSSDKDPELGVHFIALFDKWCSQYSQLASELDDKCSRLREVEQSSESLKKMNGRLQEECEQLRNTVDQCQSQLRVVCELEDEVRILKSKLGEKTEELAAKALQNETDLQSAKVTLLKEFDAKSTEMKTDFDGKMADMETKLVAEQNSHAETETQLNSVIREKEREIAKISMEYETKLAQAERQKAQYMQQQQQLLNQDIMRKKMQHMKESHQRELATLRSQLEDAQTSAQRFAPQEVSAKQQPQPLFRGRPGSRPQGRERSLSVSKRSF